MNDNDFIIIIKEKKRGKIIMKDVNIKTGRSIRIDIDRFLFESIEKKRD